MTSLAVIALLLLVAIACVASVRLCRQRTALLRALAERTHDHDLAASIVAGAQEGILTFDRKLRFTSWNPAMAKLYGIGADEVLGRTLGECFPVLVAQGLADAYHGALQGETVTISGRQITTRETGETAIVDATYRPLCDAKGGVIGGVGILRDITAEREAWVRLQQLSTVVEQTTEGVVLTDSAGDITWVNAAWSQMTGWSLEEVKGRTPGRILQGRETSDEARRAMRAAIVEGRPFFGEVLNYRKDGTSFWSSASITPIRDATGAVTAWVGIKHDVTERRAAVEALRATDERFRLLFEQSSDAHLLFDESGIVDCNAATIRLLRAQDKSQVLSLHPAVLSPEFQPDGRRSLEKAREMDATARRDGFHRFDWMHRRLDGSDVWVEVSLTPVRLQEREALLVVWHDLTERVEAEQALRRERERLADAIAALDAGIAMFDADERLLVFNDRLVHSGRDGAARPYVGMSLEEMLRATLVDGRHPVTGEDGEAWVAQNLARHRGDGESYERQLGSRSVRVGVTRTREGGSVALMTDITELKAIQRSLEEARDAANAASRAKSQFLANMSHEIRTPLNGVIGMTTLLLDTELWGDQREYAQTILRSGKALLTVLNDILDFSKIEAGHLELEYVDFEPRLVVEEVGEVVAVTAHQRGIEVVVDVDESVPEVQQGDVTRLRQVLTNLVANAVKFSPERGHVFIRANTIASTNGVAVVRYEVRDEGIGIAPEALSRLFAPFVQADASTTRRHGGTGLGLAISKRLVELMGGEIGVESTVGAGSRFWFTHPAPIGAAMRSETRDRLAGYRVLVVDDNDVARAVSSRLLEQEGGEVEVASSGGEALAILERDAAFDVVVTDGMMPEMDGPTLVKAIRGREPSRELRIVLLTSGGISAGGQGRTLGGADAMLLKPARRDALVRAVMLPADAPRVTHARVRPEGLTGMRVLVAEDDAINRLVVCTMLEQFGATVDAVDDGCAAVRQVEATPYDVVLMDFHMPEMDGLEATRVIRRAEAAKGRARLPIVALTADTVAGAADASSAAGMDAYLTKPVDRDRLVEVLLRVTMLNCGSGV